MQTMSTGFQTAYRHRPDQVACPADAAEIRQLVKAADQRPIAVQTTGHGLATPSDGGLLIDTHRLDQVRVDPATRTAHVEAGALWAKVIGLAAPHGLAPLSGSSPDVGVVGYTLGGGLGLLSRRYGYAADRVRRVELVTADGEPHTAGPGDELFWAVRGGGGNFGVVTGIEIDLFDLRRLYGGGLYFDTDLVPAVLDRYREWSPTLPEELTTSIGLIPYPDLPMVPEPLRGRYAAHVRIAYAGDAAEGERLVAPIRAVGPRLIDDLRELPYTESGTIHQDPTVPHAYRGTNAMLRELPANLPDTVMELAGPDAEVPLVVQLNQLGGALARPPEVPNPVGHRDAAYLLRMLTVVDGPPPGPAHAALDRLAATLAPHSLGRSPNFVFGEASTPEQVRTFYRPADFERLLEVKRRHDPANRFRFNQNIQSLTPTAPASRT